MSNVEIKLLEATYNPETNDVQIRGEAGNIEVFADAIAQAMAQSPVLRTKFLFAVAQYLYDCGEHELVKTLEPIGLKAAIEAKDFIKNKYPENAEQP